MTGFAEAIAYGAATIVNAISIDKGAAFGVDLYTRARVTLTSEPGYFSGHITSDPSENDSLIRASVLTVLRHFGAETRFGAEVETNSNIPIARGLKSSSAAANALVLATIGALDNSLDDESTMALSVDAAVEAKTTITGAYDDTCASFLGGIVVTNNSKRALLKVFNFPDDMSVLFHIPSEKAYTIETDVTTLRIISQQVELAFNEALNENYWTALTLNGLLHAAALKLDSSPTIEALRCGAVAAGITGKGPATVAVAATERTEAIINAWKKFSGQVVKTAVNQKKAKILRRE